MVVVRTIGKLPRRVKELAVRKAIWRGIESKLLRNAKLESLLGYCVA
jgi:hypothetical protein